MGGGVILGQSRQPQPVAQDGPQRIRRKAAGQGAVGLADRAEEWAFGQLRLIKPKRHRPCGAAFQGQPWCLILPRGFGSNQPHPQKTLRGKVFAADVLHIQRRDFGPASPARGEGQHQHGPVPISPRGNLAGGKKPLQDVTGDRLGRFRDTGAGVGAAGLLAGLLHEGGGER